MRTKDTASAHVAELLEYLEKEEHKNLLDKAWRVLYTVLIPFRTSEVYPLLSVYIVILRQLLILPETREEAGRILSIVDLIIHPRRNTVLEYQEIKEAPSV
ncbi:hypothetical protein NECID01_1155 [Nematocida sp. AWRm77]|nr:hypothetical protein NECID01_1155 [Nematocida sp. AWRm77]